MGWAKRLRRAPAAAMTNASRRLDRVAPLAWGVLGYNLLVIAWGAFVRATGSGAGCGAHWPLCNGEIVPRAPTTALIIEASHRLSSGVALVLMGVLLVRTLRTAPKGHTARRWAIASSVFLLGEALIGAALVLFELVAHDASQKRALSMSLHLTNTFFLLGALTMTARAASGGARPTLRRQGALSPILLSAGLGVILVGMSGGIAALGDTLFPARSLVHGLAQDLSPAAHVFLRLRVLHPVFAMTFGALVMLAAVAARVMRPTAAVRTRSRVTLALFTTQLAAGALNVLLLAPVWMQLVHLLLADALVISLVLLAAEALSTPLEEAQPMSSRNGPAPISDVPPSTSNVAPVTYAPAGETR